MAFSFPKGRLRPTLPVLQLDPWLAGAAWFLPWLLSLPLVHDDFLSGAATAPTLAALSWGVPALPGYPVYLLAARLATWLLPFGSFLWRLNFFSLLCGATTSWLLYRLGRRMEFSPAVSLSAALLLFSLPHVWQAALLPGPDSFHLLLVAAVSYGTVLLVTAESRTVSNPALMGAWGALCGLTAGQALMNVPWVGAALLLLILLPRTAAKTPPWGAFLLGLAAGLIVPYGYLPWRLSAAGAWINPDRVPLWTAAGQAATWTLAPAWLHEAFAALRRSAAMKAGGGVWWDFFRGLPLLNLAVLLLGLTFSLRDLLFLQPRSGDPTSAGRLVAAGLPVAALLGLALLFRRPGNGIELSLSWAMGLWSLAGLEYCYRRLGRETKSRSEGPTWFGIMLLCLVPFLSVLQTYPLLRAQARSAVAPDSSLRSARDLLQTLPLHSALLFPLSEASGPFEYLHRAEGLRPDVSLAVFGAFWPGTPGTRASGPAANLPQTGPAAFPAWNQAVNAVLSAGRPLYLLAQHGVWPNQDFLEDFELEPEGSIVPLWSLPKRLSFLSLYRVRPSPPALEVETTAAVKPVATYDRRLRLLSAQVPLVGLANRDLKILRVALTWQVLRRGTAGDYTLRLRVQPVEGNEPAAGAWEAERAWGRSLALTEFPPDIVFRELYQLFVPEWLAPGRYRVLVAVADRPTGRVFRPEPEGLAGYWVEACEFRVSGPRVSVPMPFTPYPGARRVPGK